MDDSKLVVVHTFNTRQEAELASGALEAAGIEAMIQSDMPSMRAGIAFGAALERSGDYYGHAVNLASRVTGVARPNSVLCTGHGIAV